MLVCANNHCALGQLSLVSTGLVQENVFMKCVLYHQHSNFQMLTGTGKNGSSNIIRFHCNYRLQHFLLTSQNMSVLTIPNIS